MNNRNIFVGWLREDRGIRESQESYLFLVADVSNKSIIGILPDLQSNERQSPA